VPAVEWTFWMDDGAMSRAPAGRMTELFANNRRVFDALGREEWERHANLALGAWVAAAPVPFDFSGQYAAAGVHALAGALLVVISAAGLWPGEEGNPPWKYRPNSAARAVALSRTVARADRLATRLARRVARPSRAGTAAANRTRAPLPRRPFPGRAAARAQAPATCNRGPRRLATA
jgi:hypothetical protein